MKKNLLFSAFLIGFAAAAFAGTLKTREYPLVSPDQKLKAIITIDSTIRFELYRNGNFLMSSEPIGIKLTDGTYTGINPVVKKIQQIKVDQVVKPEIREKSESIRDNYQGLKLIFKPDYSLEFRMYNEGFAYRIVLNKQADLVIENELGGYRFDARDSVCLALEKSFYSAYENPYVYKTIGILAKGDRFYLPVLVHKPDGTGLWICESNVRDYPGMWLEKSADNSVRSIFPGYPLRSRGLTVPMVRPRFSNMHPISRKQKEPGPCHGGSLRYLKKMAI